MVNLIKMLIVVAMLTALGVLMWGALTSPITPADKISRCRQDLYHIRSVLLAGDKVMGCDFFKWRETNKLNQTNMSAQACEYCKEFSRRVGENVFTIGTTDGVEYLVDPWGHAYQVSLRENIVLRDMRLHRLFVGDCIFWSVGPNGINEHGYGDDVFEFKIQTQDVIK